MAYINYKILKNKFVIYILIILSFLFLSLVSASLLLKNHSLIIAGDMPFHIRRVLELKTTFMHNDFLPSFAFNKYYGSAVMLFYPYLNLYPMVLLAFIFKSKITLIYVFFIFNTFITFIIGFYSCKNYIKDNITAYIFSIIYGLSNIFFVYNFINMDFGVVSSYIVLPLIIFGFMNILNDKNNWMELSLGMCFVAFSHILSLLIFIIFLAIFLMINFKSINKSLIKQLGKAIILFLTLTSILWLPFLNFFFHNNLNVINTPPLLQLIRSGIKPFLAGIYGKTSVESMNAFALVAIAISILFYKNFDKLIKQIYWLSLSIVFLVLIFPKELTSYGIFKAINQLQFTWRLYIIPHILLVFIFSLIITKYINKRKKVVLCIITILMAIFLQLMGQYNFINTASHNKTINIQNNNEIRSMFNYKINSSRQLLSLVNTNHEENNDYIPKKSLPISQYVNKHEGIINNNTIIPIKNIGYNTLYFKGNKNINKISLPIYMYNNENIYVYLNSNLVNHVTDKNNLLSIEGTSNDIKSNNTVYIKPVPDKFKIIGIILFNIGFIFSLLRFYKIIII